MRKTELHIDQFFQRVQCCFKCCSIAAQVHFQGKGNPLVFFFLKTQDTDINCTEPG